jgi:hypothetical protein
MLAILSQANNEGDMLVCANARPCNLHVWTLPIVEEEGDALEEQFATLSDDADSRDSLFVGDA